jgi:hypothetical protein
MMFIAYKMNLLNLKQKHIFTILLILSIFFWENILIEAFYLILVTPIINKIDINGGTYFLLACLTIGTVIYSIKAIHSNKEIKDELALVNIVFLFLFIKYRFYSNYYSDFSEWNGALGIKFVDYFLFLSLCILILKIRNILTPKDSPIYENNPFWIDKPIQDSDSDIFSRDKFAQLLASKIQSKQQNEDHGSLAIGVNGPWGSGKTSFINLVKKKLNPSNRIIIDFNPWRSSSANKIIEDFFELLISNLGKYDVTLSANLTKYAKSLTKIDENIITKSIDTVIDYLLEDLDKNEIYNRINTSIKKTNRQIIIFIDDLDRLDKRESIEVLRLIRNTANFNNVTYIVCYDKDYLEEAVKEINKHNYRLFLEKIFQFEFYLPIYDLSILRSKAKGILKGNLPMEMHPMIDAAVDFSGNTGSIYTNRCLRSYRDILRFCNSILFDIHYIKDEINFIDFYLIQLIKVKFYSIYIDLADNEEIFFIIENSKIRLRRTSEKHASLNTISLNRLFNDSKNTVSEPEDKTVFELYTDQLGDRINSEGIDFLNNIMGDLLYEKDILDTKNKDYKSFANAYNYHKYFTIQLLKSDFSISEFETYLNGDWGTLQTKIKEWIDEEKLSEITDKLTLIVDFNDVRKWERHYKVLFEIAKYKINKSGRDSVNYKQIIDVLNYPNQTLGKSEKLFASEQEYQNYIQEIFEQAPSPCVLESSILSSSLITGLELRAVDKPQVETLLLRYFQNYCDTHSEITLEFRNLHRNCIRRKGTFSDADYKIQPEAQALFRTYFQKHLRNDDLESFILQSAPGMEKFILEVEWIKTVFGSIENLKTYLQEQSNSNIDKYHYTEFLDFFINAETNKFHPIQFNFQLIKPQRFHPL